MNQPAFAPTAKTRRKVLASKETSFNVTSALLVNAVIVFLPERLQESPYIINAITAWFALGNIALRYASQEAFEAWRRHKELMRAKFSIPPLTVTATVEKTDGHQ